MTRKNLVTSQRTEDLELSKPWNEVAPSDSVLGTDRGMGQNCGSYKLRTAMINRRWSAHATTLRPVRHKCSAWYASIC